MKAIYMKPVMEIVHLQLEKDITWGLQATKSMTENVGQTNDGFFEDEPNNNGKDPFFDD